MEQHFILITLIRINSQTSFSYTFYQPEYINTKRKNGFAHKNNCAFILWYFKLPLIYLHIYSTYAFEFCCMSYSDAEQKAPPVLQHLCIISSASVNTLSSKEDLHSSQGRRVPKYVQFSCVYLLENAKQPYMK